ncbi:MAP7 domain-containing protein 1 isoform X11 [Athalia rosae]|uniref:MAP7 domain-containing protein 1 isoform X11 n=1 Tax=Athalia rosae TaxID=37344 RepID=UPI0020337340|nr:MAP7 domain-containing protein 1 isoform X11 [Athalia rosae]
MFSELCRETLRKAAVCYSSGRSASPSPSPPPSPPSSPAKEISRSSSSSSSSLSSSSTSSSGSMEIKEYRYCSDGKTNSSSTVIFKERKPPATPTDFSPAGRRARRNTLFTSTEQRQDIVCKGGYRSRRDNNNSPNEPIYDSSNSEDEAGAASEKAKPRSSNTSRNRHSFSKDVKRRSLYDEDSLDGDSPYDVQGRESVGSTKEPDRVKLVRDRQNEERQRKLEELRQQALAAQRFREQREEERRKRIDELRCRDNDRRNQVEERKRLIWEAERERREAILRKNQEREARIEAKKKNERSHIVFAFGSSTPRMLEPADTGGSTFWGTRRATSTTNVMMFTAAQPLTRRSSERELDGSKKRATSAGGLDRKPGEDMRMSSSMYEVFNWNASPDPPLTPAKIKRASLSLPPNCDIFDIDYKPAVHGRDSRPPNITQRTVSGEESDGTPGTPSSAYLRVNRRRTDLMPTIPSPRDGIPSTGRSSSAKAFTRSPGIRSGEVTPCSPSRPHSSLSQQSGSSVGSSNVSLRPRTTTPRRPRPASIAGTGVTVTERHNFVGDIKISKDSKPPLPKVHNSTPKKPSTQKVAEIVKKPTDKLIKSAKASPRITPRATPLQSPGNEQPPLIQTNIEVEETKHENVTTDQKEFDRKLIERNEEKLDHGTEKIETQQESTVTETKVEQTTAVIAETKPEEPAIVAELSDKNETDLSIQDHLSSARSTSATAPVQPLGETTVKPEKKDEKKVDKKNPDTEFKSEGDGEEPVDMTASMIAKTRITTEEEAKAALAERRRLARVQAEREAELERQRIEAEIRLEEERQRAEEEEQRRLEEETLRLASEARQAEEQRLRLAIEEAQRREEEDRKRREEEARQKVEKEEAERKAREEAEKQRIEMAERLKKEEEERIARRKRVEAIMLRTRGKNQPNTPTKGEGGDGDKLKEESPGDEGKGLSVDKGLGSDVMTASLISEATQQFIAAEQQALHIEHNSISSTLTTTTTTTTMPLEIIRNGSTHTNGVNGGSNNLLLDNAQGNGEGELNGHHNTNHGNGINSHNEPLVALDNATVKQNNATNNLLDLSEFADNMSNSTTTGQILELTPKLANEDSINSNLNPTAIPFNPLGNQFVPTSTNANDNTNSFQDTFGNKTQDNNQVPDLLS